MSKNSPERRADMAARRQKQRVRTIGFTRMPNKHVNAAMQGELTRLTVVELAQGRTPDTMELQRQAVKNVAAKLPKAAPSKLYRPGPTTRSDDPAWRAGTRQQAAR